MRNNIQNNTGLFVPSTNVWEVQTLQVNEDISPALKDVLVRLYQNINNIEVALNLKDSGYYQKYEFLNGQQLFSDSSNPDITGRQIYRTVVDFGALPNATSKSIAHNIGFTNGFSTTRIYGSSTDNISMEYIPLPYSSPTLNENIALSIDQTNVTITTGIDMTAYTITYIVVEYVKQ